MNSANQENIKKLWDLAYGVFEGQPSSNFKTFFGMRSATNDVQFRLMKHLADVRNGGATKEALEAVRGDILTAEALSIFVPKTAEEMLQILDKIEKSAYAK